MLHWLNNVIGLIDSTGRVAGLKSGQKTGFFPVCLLARHLYREEVVHYPVTTRAELKRILKHAPQPEASVVLHDVVADDKGFWVKRYIIDKSVIPADQYRPVFIIPHSKWVASTLTENAVAKINTQPSYYLYCNQDKHQSLIEQGNISDAQRFIDAVGAPGKLGNQCLQVDAVLPLQSWLQVWKLSKGLGGGFLPFTPARLKRWFGYPVSIGLLLITFYHVIASGYLYWQQHALKSQQSHISTDLGSVLNQQQQSSRLSEQVEQIHNQLAQTRHTSDIWPLAQIAINAGARLSLIKYEQNNYVINGSASSASGVLAAIQASGLVESAGFGTPIAVRSGREVFSIDVRLPIQSPQTGDGGEQ